MAHVLVICARRYNGHELWTLLKRLRVHAHTFEVVSSDTTIRDELSLQPNTISRTLYEVDEATEISGAGAVGGVGNAFPDNHCPPQKPTFDGVCVVSGNMSDTEAYWTNEKVLSILQAFRSADKVVAAICCSVPTLAPICRGVKVSPFPLVRSKHRLLRHGAILQTTSICVDFEHKTITAENQMMSYLWADSISAVLNGEMPTLNFTETEYANNFRGRTPRKLPQDLEEQLSKFRPTPAQIYKKDDSD